MGFLGQKYLQTREGMERYFQDPKFHKECDDRGDTKDPQVLRELKQSQTVKPVEECPPSSQTQ